jgi:hypothetical protein
MHEIETPTFRTLSDALNRHLLEYGDELGECPVIVQDNDGILYRRVTSFDLANGPYIIVTNEDEKV